MPASTAPPRSLLTAGFIFIRRKNVIAHRAAMLPRSRISVAFLACYLAYHLRRAPARHSAARVSSAAFTLRCSISHILLATAIVPTDPDHPHAGGCWGRFDRHRPVRDGRSVVVLRERHGVLVYLFLYHGAGRAVRRPRFTSALDLSGQRTTRISAAAGGSSRA